MYSKFARISTWYPLFLKISRYKKRNGASELLRLNFTICQHFELNQSFRVSLKNPSAHMNSTQRSQNEHKELSSFSNIHLSDYLVLITFLGVKDHLPCWLRKSKQEINSMLINTKVIPGENKSFFKCYWP